MKTNKMTLKSTERPQDIMRCFNKHIFRICFIDGEPWIDEQDVMAYFKINSYDKYTEHTPDDCRKLRHVSRMGIESLSYYYVDIETDELLEWLDKIEDPNPPKEDEKVSEEMNQNEQTAMQVFENQKAAVALSVMRKIM